tara:strand:- start:5976 stop:7133 length:1158 start_codon:yes stop_codon:yes gene_type:complete
MIPYGRQHISEDDIEAVETVLKSDFLTQGPQVPKFEKEVRDKYGANFSYAFNSATSALHIACLSLGVGKGDVVWTSPITYVASSNCALYCGANVDFVDIDPNTFNISIEALEQKLRFAKQKDALPKVLIPVHLAGEPCNMQAIKKLSDQYGFKIIEDASHAIGAKYKNNFIGNCNYSDIVVFSFHPVKIITTGEGGMALTNNKSTAKKLDILRTHGVTRNPEDMTKEPDGPWYYQQIGLGYNYRMHDISAALGISQLKRIDKFIKCRHKIAEIYDESFLDLPLQKQYRDQENYSSLHLYIINLEIDYLKKTHLEIFKDLRKKGIGVNIHYIPVHTQPYYQSLGFKYGDFPASESYYKRALSLPIFPNLSEDKLSEVISAVKSVIK